MFAFNNLARTQIVSHLLTNNDIIIEVSYDFLTMTGYSEDFFLHKNILDVFKALRMNITSSITSDTSFYLFTSNFEVREVNILTVKGPTTCEKIYIFSENPYSRLETKFPCIEQLYGANSIGVAVISVPDLIMLKANQPFLDFLDEPYNNKENSLGLSIAETFTNWKESSLHIIFKNAISTKTAAQLKEHHYEGFKKGIAYFDLIITPVCEDGIVKYLVANATDVTDKVLHRIKLEEQAKVIVQQNRQLEAIIENISDALFIVDSNGNFIDINNSARNILSNSLTNEVNIYSTSNNIENNALNINNTLFSQIVKGEKLYLSKMKIKQDYKELYYDVNATPIFDDNGNFIMGVICGHDVTERIIYEDTLKKQRDNLCQIIDNLDLPIIRLAYPNLKLIEINKKAYEITKNFNTVKTQCLDLINDEIYLHNILDSTEILDFYGLLKAVKRKKNAAYWNMFEILIDDKKTYHNIILQPLIDSYDNISELLIISIDVTHEVEKRNELEKLLKMKEDFFSFVSHEFKTPLTVIYSAIQAIQCLYKNQLPDKCESFINKIKQNSLRQLRLINNLLDVTRSEAGYLKIYKTNADIVSMTKAITESVILYANDKGIDLHFKSEIPKRIIAIDDEKFERILLNLLSNAIKFTPSGKSIYVNISSQNDKIKIEVTDEGIGIPNEKLNVIFDRFGQVSSSLTRKAEGTGIGLCLVKLLANSLGGEISVDSIEGKGTTFTLLLDDSIIYEEFNENIFHNSSDARLIQTTAIEFSDIYSV